MLKWVVFSKPQEFRKRVVVSWNYIFTYIVVVCNLNGFLFFTLSYFDQTKDYSSNSAKNVGILQEGMIKIHT